MGKQSSCDCCHHDGYLHRWVFAVVLILGLVIGVYIVVVLFSGITGGPLTPLQVAIIIVIVCAALILLLIFYYAPKERRKYKDYRRDD